MGAGATETGLRVESLSGEALLGALPALAALRIEVFRAFPYLYDGDLEYERGYLASYAQAPGAVVVGAFDGARLVGAATAAPLSGEKTEWTDPLAAAGIDVPRTFYCGESVLLPAYRGRGVGHAFFDHREAAARAQGMTYCCFCAVIRPEDHPARPEGYRPLDGFWRARGYAPIDGVTAAFSWREVGRSEESEHRLQYWGRAL